MTLVNKESNIPITFHDGIKKNKILIEQERIKQEELKKIRTGGKSEEQKKKSYG